MAHHRFPASPPGRVPTGLLACAVVVGLTACQFGTAFYPGDGADAGARPDASLPPGPDGSPPAPDASPAPDSGPTCEDECTLGAIACAASGSGTQMCVAGAGGCTVWQAEETCGPREVCQSASCVCEGSPCTPGATRCGASGGVETCQGPDADGCTYWGGETTCPTGLVCEPSLGECRPDTPTGCYPLNECDYEGQKTCTSSFTYRECIYGPDGCLEWDCAS